MAKLGPKKSEKSQISKIFAELRKYGYLVFNFNQKQAFGKGLTGFVDHIIVGKGLLIFIEVKIGKDTLSAEQKMLLDELFKIDDIVVELVYSVDDARRIQEQILSADAV